LISIIESEDVCKKNGTFKGVFDVNKDAAYEFKYVIDGICQ
jgi:hypothetical protein